MRHVAKLLLAGLMVIAAGKASAQEYAQIPVAFQLTTTVSDGARSIEEMAALCRAYGFKAMVVTDFDLKQWDYVFVHKRQPSVRTYGIERYLAEIRRVQQRYPDLVLIPGVEAMPYYYWSGVPFTRGFSLHNAHVHMLAVGMPRAEDYRRLPSARHGPDRGTAPYQEFIEYVRAHQGLVFWAHPDAAYLDRQGGVRIVTRAYGAWLARTRDYTGFAYWYEGSRAGAVGGPWDQALMQYCRGERKAPVWAIAGLGIEEGVDPDQCLADLRTVVWARSADQEGILEAMGQGRMYLVKGTRAAAFRLEKFTVRGSALEIAGGFSDGTPLSLQVTVISRGSVIRQETVTAPFDLSLPAGDDGTQQSYYRAVIEGDGISIVTNPVFTHNITIDASVR